MTQLFQSNHKGEIIQMTHRARDEAAGISINPGAFTHTSVAIQDALNAFDGQVFKVHISNLHKRESFRHYSCVLLKDDGVIAGFGIQGYQPAIRRPASTLA